MNVWSTQQLWSCEEIPIKERQPVGNPPVKVGGSAQLLGCVLWGKRLSQQSLLTHEQTIKIAFISKLRGGLNKTTLLLEGSGVVPGEMKDSAPFQGSLLCVMWSHVMWRSQSCRFSHKLYATRRRSNRKLKSINAIWKSRWVFWQVQHKILMNLLCIINLFHFIFHSGAWLEAGPDHQMLRRDSVSCSQYFSVEFFFGVSPVGSSSKVIVLACKYIYSSVRTKYL